jgi:hypothetical protein
MSGEAVARNRGVAAGSVSVCLRGVRAAPAGRNPPRHDACPTGCGWAGRRPLAHPLSALVAGADGTDGRRRIVPKPLFGCSQPCTPMPDLIQNLRPASGRVRKLSGDRLRQWSNRHWPDPGG